jgi:transcriptional regulator with XRE-family HTH domain
MANRNGTTSERDGLIRAFRKQRGLSLRELASKSGLSPSLVSQVERGISEPSISSLRKIAEALDVSIFYLLDDRPGLQDSPGESITKQVVRRGDRRRLTLPSSGLRYELLCPDTERNMEAWIATLQPGVATGDTLRGHPSEEFLLVLSGTMELEYGGETVLLEEGDSVYYDGREPHRLWARGDTPLRMLSVLSPPVL